MPAPTMTIFMRSSILSSAGTGSVGDPPAQSSHIIADTRQKQISFFVKTQKIGRQLFSCLPLCGMLFCGNHEYFRIRRRSNEQSPVKLRLYCSICARTTSTWTGSAAADQLGLDYTLEKITDDDELNRMDLTVPCLYAYCPGCRMLNEQVTSEHPRPSALPPWRSMGSPVLGRPRQRRGRCGRRRLPYNLRLKHDGEGGRSPKFYLTNRHKPHKINVKLFLVKLF